MANNVEVKDASGVTQTFKTTDTGGVHTGHTRVDASALPTGAATEAAQEDIITSLGAPDDAAASGDGSIIGVLKQLRVLLGGTLAVSGTVTANTGLSQPLTDTQLRASAVPVSHSGLTDTQLRNSAVPVSVSGVATDAKLDTLITALGGQDDAAATGNGSLIAIAKQLRVLLGASAAAADGRANPTSGFLGAAVQWFNGTTWDRAPGSTTNGLLVDLGANNDVTLAVLPDTAAGNLADIETAVNALAALISGGALAVSGTFDPPEGGATEAKQDSAITILGTIDSVLDGILADTDGIQTLLSGIDTVLDAILVDTGQIETLLTAMDADTSAMVTDLAAIEVLLGTIDTDTGALVTAIGETGDTAATAGSTGSISAKLRLMTTQLNSIMTSLLYPLAGHTESVAASQTNQVLGATGATGDYLSHLLVVPTTVDAGAIAVLDNATSRSVFAGGTGSLTNLVPFVIPIGAYSVSGSWRVTTGAGLSVWAFGRFT